MKKVSILFLIVISLIATSFAGIGVPRAKAAALTVTASASPATVNTTTALNISAYPTAVSQFYLVLSLPSFQLPGTIPTSAVTVNSVAAASVAVYGNQIVVGTSTPFSSYAAVAFSSAAGIKTPVSAGSYPISCTVGSDSGSSPAISITGSATPSFTAQLYPTTAGVKTT